MFKSNKGDFFKYTPVLIKLIVKYLLSYFVGSKAPTVDLLNKLISGYQMV